MRALKCLRNIEIIRKKHEMAVAKQQSEAWRKALDGVPDSLRMLLEINNTENVPEYSEKQKKQYNEFNSHPRFPFCKRVSHFESDLQILYPTFHFCNDFPVFSLAFMI